MKATELRIGNLFQNNHNSLIVLEVTEIKDEIGGISISGKTFDGKFNAYFYEEDVSPIPLTEEWLEKFGFNTEHLYIELSEYKDESERLNDLSISFSNGIVEISLTVYDKEGEIESVIYYNLPKIKYVHQLQNLYFALTNEELELKEKLV